jgi:phosphate starvation-inducible PhoH-like protein
MSTEMEIYEKEIFDNVCGTDNCHLEIIEKSLGVEINTEKLDHYDDYYYYIVISDDNAKQAKDILQSLELLSKSKTIETSDVEMMLKCNSQQINDVLSILELLSESKTIETSDIEMMLKCNSQKINDILQYLKKLSEFKSIDINDVEMAIEYYTQDTLSDKFISIDTSHKVIKTQSINQRNYVKSIKEKDCTFAISSERTGKTYLAIACAIEALNDEHSSITRIVITSRAIKDNNYGNKIKNSYLLSIYDILYELIGCEETTRLLKANIIEVSQSKLMDERVLNNTFIIFDNYNDDYNIKEEIIYMGFESKIVIIKNAYEYEYTNSDYINKRNSDYIKTIKELKEEPDISFCYFYGCDIVKKHKLAQLIAQII